MILCKCPNCHAKLWLLSKTIRRRTTCPACKKNFSLTDAKMIEISKKDFANQIFEKIPLLDIGTREKELTLTEEDLTFLGEMFLLHIIAVDHWQELNHNELDRIKERMRDLIEILDRHNLDSNLTRLEFNLLNAFIRNFYD
jgi:hypothetical protein